MSLANIDNLFTKNINIAKTTAISRAKIEKTVIKIKSIKIFKKTIH